MFRLSKPNRAAVDGLLATQRDLPFTYPGVGITAPSAVTSPTVRSPIGYVVDHNRSRLGFGPTTFAQACAAMRQWIMYDFGWIELCWPDAPLVKDTTVGVLAHLPVGYVLNVCRIVYVLEEETDGISRFGFAYGTLPAHVERGEERFLIEWHHRDDSVWYDILAFSRPNHLLVKLGYPVARLYQRRFARDSLRRMGGVSRG